MSTTKYYKIPEGTDTFQKVKEMFNQIKESNKSAVALAVELRAKDGRILGNTFYAAGQISAFDMPEKPDGWKEIKSRNVYGNWCFPKSGKGNKDLLKKIYDIPTIRRSEIDCLVGYEDVFGGPGIFDAGDCFLVEMADGNPKSDMIEIKGSEFLAIKENYKEKQKES